MKLTKKCIALLLVLCMVMSFLPMSVFAEELAADGGSEVQSGQLSEEAALSAQAAYEAKAASDIDERRGLEYVAPPSTSGDPLYKVLHIDAGRKYTSLATLKKLVDYVAFNGMNQIDLYLSDNQGLRFGVLDAEGKFIIRANSTEYDLTDALGYYENDREPTKQTDYIDSYLTPAEMKDLIIYAADKNVDIVPSINMPGHMAAILQGSGDERVSAFGKTFEVNSGSYLSNESLDMGNVEAVNFALALLDTYCNYFYGITDAAGNRLVKYFSIAGDEYGQDLLYNAWAGSGFGTAYMKAKGEYGDLVNFLNRAGNVIKGYGMTPRAFNDPFLSDYNTDAEALGLNTDWQLYYWGGGWGGMTNASPETLNKAGFDVINSNSDYYYICCQGRPYKNYIDTVAGIQNNPFELKKFATGTVNFDPAGAMFCIWCDHCTGGTSHEQNISGEGMEVMSAWAAGLQSVPDVTYDYVEITDPVTRIKIGAAGLSQISVTQLASNPTIAAAASGKIRTYSVQMLNEQTGYSDGYKVYIPIPDGWDSSKVYGFTVGQLMTAAEEAELPTQDAGGTVKDGYYVADVSSGYATLGIYEAAPAAEGTEIKNITLSVGESYDLGTLTGDHRSAAKEYDKFKIEQTGFKEAVDDIPATDPKAADVAALESGKSYLISDGIGHYMSLDNSGDSSTITSSTDPASATKWTVTINDGKYTFSAVGKQWGNEGRTLYLGFITGVACGHSTAILQADTFAWSYNNSGFYANVDCWDGTHDGDWYLTYNDGWAISLGSSSGVSVYTPGTEAIPGTPAETSLKLTATAAGQESVTIGSTTYNVTVIAALSSAECTEHGIKVYGHGVDGLTCAPATVGSITGYETVEGVSISGYTLTPKVGEATYSGDVKVEMNVPAAWTEGGLIKAFIVQNGAAVEVPVTIENGVATYTAPGGSTSGLFKLPAGYFTNEVNILMGDNSTTTRIQTGSWTTADVYYGDDQGLVTVTAQETSPYVPAIPEGIVPNVSAGEGYYITDGNGNYLTVVNGAISNTTDKDSATVWSYSETGNSGNETRLNFWGSGYQLNGYENGNVSLSGGAGYGACFAFSEESGLYQTFWNGTRYLYFNGTKWTTSTDSAQRCYMYGTGSKAVDAKSTVTIQSADKLGTTYVVVGTTRYNITVASAELVNNSITIYSMISNNLVKIGEDANGAVCHVDVNAAMLGITSEEGIDVSALFPATAIRNTDPMVFWKMTWLPFGARQSTETGSPYLNKDDVSPRGPYEGVYGDTTSGQFDYEERVDFARLRYYNNRWEFYLDHDEDAWYEGEMWAEGWYPVNPTEEDVANGMTTTAGNGQIVAYYLQETDVTAEVITNVADWGPEISNATNISYGAGYVLLDFAIREESGNRIPNEVGTYPIDDKTMGFHCLEGWGSNVTKDANGVLWRTVNSIMATTDTINGYDIYMITATKSATADNTDGLRTVATGTDANTSTNKRINNPDGTTTGGYDYDTSTETIVWLKDENVQYDANSYLIDENVAYGYRENGTHTNGVPYVASVTIQQQHAVLITYYVRYVGQTEDDLRVHYINRTLNDLEFYTYGIRVKSGTVFDPTFAMDGTEFGLIGNTVENYNGNTQVVEGDPREIVDVQLESFYRSTKLDLREVKRSDDGKDVYLYYHTDNAKDMVIDFGLPVEITTASMQINLNADEKLYMMAADNGVYDDATGLLVTDGKYGSFVTVGNPDAIGVDTLPYYYVPTQVMRGTENVHMTVHTDKPSSTNAHRYFLDVHPATTMYYEEYFATYTGSWTGGAMPALKDRIYDAAQQGAYPGMSGANNYGYDGAYTGAVTESTAQTATVGDKLEFEFTGDGVEIYAQCTQDTGTVMVVLYQVTASGDVVDSVYLVDTVRKDGGKITVDDEEIEVEGSLTTGQAAGSSYNTPIVSIRDLAHGDYKVRITFTKYTQATDGFIFDGFRVFNTMGNTIDAEVYNPDKESSPAFIEIRDSLLYAEIPTKGEAINNSIYANQIAASLSSQVYSLKDTSVQAVLISESANVLSGNVNVQTDYLENGSKNEVYIKPGQTLTITLPGKSTAANTQVGMKVLSGTVKLDDTTLCQTNMYYPTDAAGDFKAETDEGDLTSTITIVNTTGAIISVTDLKVPGGLPAVDDGGSSVNSLRSVFSRTLLSMGYQEAPEVTEPEVTEPEVTEPEVTEPEDTYDASAVYLGGDTVVYNGKTYKAKWWTQGENPETAIVWELVSSGEGTDGIAEWNASNVYTAGMQVSYNGQVYEAKWWTSGENPETAYVWTLIS